MDPAAPDNGGSRILQTVILAFNQLGIQMSNSEGIVVTLKTAETL